MESHTRALARRAGPGRGGAKGARHAREWSAEILAEPHFSSLRPDRRGASAIRREQVFGTLRLLDPAPGEGE